ncbi:melanoma-associated antigen B1-like [Pteropus medius]|uniref:Melanoma-associated antigen B1-like n=1 Tax=Pteropus vampyrus TaxID=132908 RepID=A0A6P3RQJ1_PTEVA|nr:melanoma-associated antigen B1-like [Pteropus vampyrus]XP_011385586.1 melanoma-associated antigen B1-like [Pteropus vampyrus]XP_011385793.1 melanoma-associated antigen B1-like [Pteropus vampyrus]XP_039724623.1 melanoma-associated antigen B1-like [Pteropus giganteus]XP_039724627.1 melanoma-associated antigen B1-like [Pteropus giganteus]
MPRGQKSKLRAREKRRQNRAEAQGLKSAQAATAEGEATASSPPVTGDGASSSSDAGSLQAPASVSAATSATAGVSCKRSDVRGKSHVQKSKKSQAAHCSESSGQDLLTRKAGILANYLLCKYKMNEPIKKGDMLKVIHKRYREHFPEILKKASERMDLFFGLEVKEVKPNSHSYSLVCKLDDTSEGSVSFAWQFPTKGILMPLLGLIFLNGNRASEEEIWELLNIFGVYAGKTHFIFGEPRKLITQDLVQENYLEYRQVPGSDPPRFEFLWGPRAQAETTKAKVLDFLSKVKDTVSTDFPPRYEEILRDEQERARATAATMAGATDKARARSRATSSRDPPPE